ncbi:MAG: DUF4361 domain-containing protein [Cyclobacteriaceae bacterium]|nr:DUF4361 domain-containing protein [Cyclobacteriaceae bacterium]
MKKTDLIRITYVSILVLGISGCYNQDFENGTFQAIDSNGKTQKIIGTAVTATGNSEFAAVGVDASLENRQFSLIPIVLNSKDFASEDIHVQMIVALDSLDSYNKANKTKYVMPGGSGTPVFTLVDDGLVTISKGSNVGYLKIMTKSAEYFTAVTYAFPYRIASVKEQGYVISGNHNFGIVALIPKNIYDGEYRSTGTFTRLGVTRGINRDKKLSSVNSNTCNTEFADLGPSSMNLTVNPDNTVTLVPKDDANPGTIQLYTEPGDNTYDPSKKTFKIHYSYGGGTREGKETIKKK